MAIENRKLLDVANANPDADGTRDLGENSTPLRWRDLYASGVRLGGTNSKLFEHDGSEIDPDTADFQLVVWTDFPAQARDDVIYALGYNIANTGGGPRVASESALAIIWETIYEPGGNPQMEWYVSFWDDGGTNHRILQFELDRSGGSLENIGVCQLDYFSFNDHGGAQIFKANMAGKSFEVYSWGVLLKHDNNQGWIRQLNQAAATYVNLTHLNAADEVVLGDDNATGCWARKYMAIDDGIATPTTRAGLAILFVDSADGDLKVKFGDGTVKLIVTDT